jgi:hypothetical protein
MIGTRERRRNPTSMVSVTHSYLEIVEGAV